MSSDRAPLLETRGVTRHFGGIAALDGATLDVREGSITALIGPNGAGKTTLYNVITGFIRPEHGSVHFDGHPIHRRRPDTITRRGLVRTFQIPRALRRMTVLENMMLAAPGHPGEHLSRVLFTPRSARRFEREVEPRARNLLKLVRLDTLADEYAGTLSGGQRKLLEFGRALMCEPRMIMLDEPMAGVNPTLGRELLDHVVRLRDEQGITFLLIEHDMEVVMSVGERVIVLNQGTVIADGSPEEVRADQGVIDAYLGAHAQDGVPADVAAGDPAADDETPAAAPEDDGGDAGR